MAKPRKPNPSQINSGPGMMINSYAMGRLQSTCAHKRRAEANPLDQSL